MLGIPEQKVGQTDVGAIPIKSHLPSNSRYVHVDVSHRYPYLSAKLELVSTEGQADRVGPLKLVGLLELGQKVRRTDAAKSRLTSNRLSPATRRSIYAGDSAALAGKVLHTLEAEVRKRVQTDRVLRREGIITPPSEAEFIDQSSAE